MQYDFFNINFLDSNDFSKQTRGSISDSSLTLSEHFSMPSPQASPYLRKKLPTSTPYRTEGSLDSSSGSRLVKPKDSSSEGEGSIEEDKSTYILLFTSNDRLELTVTPSALQTIQMYSKVSWFTLFSALKCTKMVMVIQSKYEFT